MSTEDDNKINIEGEEALQEDLEKLEIQRAHEENSKKSNIPYKKAEILTNENTQQKQEEPKNIIFSIGITILTRILFSLSQIQLKSLHSVFPKTFSINTALFYRGISQMLLSYYYLKFQNKRILRLSEISEKAWFIIRFSVTYPILFFFLHLAYYFRTPTIQNFLCSHPVAILVLAVIGKAQKLTRKYSMWIITSLIGLTIILSNEADEDIRENMEGKQVMVGVMFAMGYMLFLSFSNFGQKILEDQNIPDGVESFYLGLSISVGALFFMVFDWYVTFDVRYICYCFLNGALYFTVNQLSSVSYKSLPNKYYLVTIYCGNVFVYLFGYLLLSEEIYVSDIVGNVFVIVYPLYNEWNPDNSQDDASLLFDDEYERFMQPEKKVRTRIIKKKKLKTKLKVKKVKDVNEVNEGTGLKEEIEETKDYDKNK